MSWSLTNEVSTPPPPPFAENVNFKVRIWFCSFKNKFDEIKKNRSNFLKNKCKFMFQIK